MTPRGRQGKWRAAGLILALVTWVPPAGPVSGQEPAALQERDFMSRVRRLTVEGRRAGEGYWSPDGSRLVFQSERGPGNPFFGASRTSPR